MKTEFLQNIFLEDTIKKEEDQGVGLELNAPTVGRKRKRPRMESPEKVVKKEKVEAPPPKVKPDADMISKDSVKGHLSLIRKHLFNARQGEMMMRAHLARITTSLDELAKKLE